MQVIRENWHSNTKMDHSVLSEIVINPEACGGYQSIGALYQTFIKSWFYFDGWFKQFLLYVYIWMVFFSFLKDKIRKFVIKWKSLPTINTFISKGWRPLLSNPSTKPNLTSSLMTRLCREPLIGWSADRTVTDPSQNRVVSFTKICRCLLIHVELM